MPDYNEPVVLRSTRCTGMYLTVALRTETCYGARRLWHSVFGIDVLFTDLFVTQSRTSVTPSIAAWLRTSRRQLCMANLSSTSPNEVSSVGPIQFPNTAPYREVAMTGHDSAVASLLEGDCSTVRQSLRLVTGVGVTMLIIFSIVGLSHELADEDIGNVSTIPPFPQPEVEPSATCANPYQQ